MATSWQPTEEEIRDASDLPLLPADQVALGYRYVEDALRQLHEVNLADFKPLPTSDELSVQDEAYDRLAVILGWVLRLADGFANQPLVAEIQAAIAPFPYFEFYVVYTLLSAAYEAEGELQTRGYRLPPPTHGLKRFAVGVVTRHLRATTALTDLQRIAIILSRVTCWLPYSSWPESYIGVYDVEPILSAADERRALEPFDDPAWIDVLESIRSYRLRVLNYMLEQGDRGRLL